MNTSRMAALMRGVLTASAMTLAVMPALAAQKQTDAQASLSESKGSFTAGKGTFLLNGEPYVVKAAELHYPRIPRPYWDDRI